MKYQEILEALNRGETVHWKNRIYTVRFHLIGINNDLLICCGDLSCEGIQIKDGEIFSHSQDDFYLDISPDFADIGRIIPHLYKNLRDYKEKTGLTYFRDYFIRVGMGKKYFKLFACEIYPDGKTNTGRLICFVDKTTGDIYKPASYAAPAKHARGNVNSDSCGMEAFNEGGFVRYLN